MFVVGAVVLSLAAFAILALGRYRTRRQRVRTGLHAVVAAVAAGAYALMALGYGRAADESGDPVNLIVFADGIITMPLLLTGLALTATPGGRRAVGLMAALAFVAAVTMATGGVMALNDGLTAWVWFVVMGIAFAILVATIWVPLRDLAGEGHPYRLVTFDRHAGVLTLFLVLYPLVTVVGPQGAGVAGPTVTVALFLILDFALKGAYGLLVVVEDERLTLAAKAERAWPTSADVDVPDKGAMARERLMARQTRERVRRVAAERLTGAADALGRARTAGRARLSGLAHRRAAAARQATDAPVRERPKRAPIQTPFGTVTRSDIAPAAAIAAVLLAITWPKKR